MKTNTIVLEDFLRFMSFRRGSPASTIDTYRCTILDFFKIIDKSVYDLTIQDVDRYSDYLSLQGFKPRTYRNKLTTVRSFVKYLYMYDITTLNPIKIIVPKEKYQEANFLDKIETKKLIGCIDNIRDKAMILCLVSSGLRVSELINVKLVDLFDRSIVVRNGKGGKPRVTFITKEAQLAIDNYLKIRGTQEGYLFPNPYGESISRVVIARKVKYYSKKAKINKKVTPHTLRHTMATTMLSNGGRVEDVQQILGHTNITNTMHYLHFTNRQLQKSYNKVM